MSGSQILLLGCEKKLETYMGSWGKKIVSGEQNHLGGRCERLESQDIQ